MRKHTLAAAVLVQALPGRNRTVTWATTAELTREQTLAAALDRLGTPTRTP
ncbi:hypothetical protein ACWD4O_35605 [Streptomyces sp. NPDC002623]